MFIVFIYHFIVVFNYCIFIVVLSSFIVILFVVFFFVIILYRTLLFLLLFYFCYFDWALTQWSPKVRPIFRPMFSSKKEGPDCSPSEVQKAMKFGLFCKPNSSPQAGRQPNRPAVPRFRVRPQPSCCFPSPTLQCTDLSPLHAARASALHFLALPRHAPANAPSREDSSLEQPLLVWPVSSRPHDIDSSSSPIPDQWTRPLPVGQALASLSSG